MSSLPPYQQRVIAELAELNDKRKKLAGFIVSDKFIIVCNEAEQFRMHAQMKAMNEYSYALSDRIDAFVQGQ